MKITNTNIFKGSAFDRYHHPLADVPTLLLPAPRLGFHSITVCPAVTQDLLFQHRFCNYGFTKVGLFVNNGLPIIVGKHPK